MSFQVPPFARLGTMSVARPIGCSPFSAWTGSREYPSVMKMWKWRFIQRMSGRSRRSILSPGKPGIGTKRPPRTVLQRWGLSFVVRILAAAEETATTPAAARRSERSQATHLDPGCRVPAIDHLDRHFAAGPEAPRPPRTGPGPQLDWLR